MADRNRTSFYNKHGHILYEEMVRVPLIIKLPGQRAAGKRVTGLARMIDIMPTILDLVGVAAEGNEMQGRSLDFYWTQKDPPPKQAAITEALAFKGEKKSWRTDRYKYIVSLNPETVSKYGRGYLPETPPKQELYDLQNDPLEKNNLLAAEHDPELDALATTFYGQLRSYITKNQGKAEPTQLDKATIDKLRSLGYINGD
jgi:arylsulfatase A-like enzyme